MSKGVNKVIIIGNAGSDADARFMPNGNTVANVSIATSESWRDKHTGQMQERTEWHRVVFMDRGNYHLGKIAGDFIKKGSKVYVEGSLRTREWEKDGVKRYSTEIIANEMQLMDSRPENQQPQQQGGYQQQNNGYAQPQDYMQPPPHQPRPQPQSYGSWPQPQQQNPNGQQR